MIKKYLGSIKSISVGFGGYDDAMFGVSISLGSDCWGVEDFKGTWGFNPSETAQWTKADQLEHWGETMEWLCDLMKAANVNSVERLRGIPVEITMENERLKSWRILTEVLK